MALQGIIAAAPYIMAGLEMAGQIGGAHYGAKRNRKQQEENERATARAAMVSALTGQRAAPSPATIGSAGADAFQTIGNIGSIGSKLLPFIKGKSPITTGQTPDNPILMPNTDVIGSKINSPPLRPRPNRIMGGIHNPLPPTGLSGVGYTNPTRPYS